MSEARRTADALSAAHDHVQAAKSAATQHRNRGRSEWPSHIKDLHDLVIGMEMFGYLTRDLAGVAKSCADDARANYFHGDAPNGQPWNDSVTDAARDVDQALSKLRGYLEKAPVWNAHNAMGLLHAAVQNARRAAR
jgi:hypothetical protein